MKLFKPVDFTELLSMLSPSPIQAAEIANKILNEYLEHCPVVFKTTKDSSAKYKDQWLEYPNPIDTHTAKIIDIKEINKQPGTLYVDSGITMNGETLYKKVIK